MMLMRSLNGLAVAFDFKTEAARRAHNSDWTYVLVTFGPSGVNAQTLPLGTRDLLDSAYEDALLDDGVAYAAAFDKTEDDLIPVRSAHEADSPFALPIKMPSKAAAAKYGKYILGGLAITLGFFGLSHARKRFAKPALSR